MHDSVIFYMFIVFHSKFKAIGGAGEALTKLQSFNIKESLFQGTPNFQYK